MSQTEDLTLDDECMSILHQFAEEYEDRNIRDALTMAVRLAEQICLLDENRDLQSIRQMDWHIKANATVIFLAHRLKDEPQMIHANTLIAHLRPLYAEGLIRWDRKSTWQRNHMNKFREGDWVVWRGTGAQIVHAPVLLLGQDEYTIQFSVNTPTGTIVQEKNVHGDELKAQKPK